MSDQQQKFRVELTRVELGGSLAAVRAVADASPTGPPEPLVSAADKFEGALAQQHSGDDQQVGAEAKYQSVVAAARFLLDHSAGHPSRPSAQRSCWNALARALAALPLQAPDPVEQQEEFETTENDRKHIDCLRKTGASQVASGEGFAVLAGEENLRLADRLEAEWFPEPKGASQ